MSRLLARLRKLAQEQSTQDQLILAGQNAYYPTEIVYVNTLADLPQAISGVITLLANTSYVFVGTVDLVGNRLVGSLNTAILGVSLENCRLISTGLSASTALITSAWSTPIRHITITHGTALALDASANPGQALSFEYVNFVNCTTVGLIKGYSNFIMSIGLLSGSANMTFDGTIGTVAITNSLMVGVPGQRILIFPSTFVSTRRLRITYSAFTVPPGGTGIDANVAATIPTERYILDTVEFGGAGTAISGITADDNRSLFTNCVGVKNAGAICSIYMVSNATETTIGAVGTFYKINGTSTAGSNVQRFSTAVTNRMTYTGASTDLFYVALFVAITTGNLQDISVRIAKNGVSLVESQGGVETTVASSGHRFGISCQAIVQMDPNDYVEPFVANLTSTTAVTGKDMTFTISRVF